MNQGELLKMKKYLITDLDGTLLKSDGTLSEETICFFRNHKNLFEKIILCSGRHLDEIKDVAERIGIAEKDIIISSDGLYAYTGNGNKIHELKFLNTDDALKVYKILNVNSVFAYTDVIDYILSNSRLRCIKYYIKGFMGKRIKKAKFMGKRQKVSIKQGIEKIQVYEFVPEEKLSHLRELYTVHKLKNGIIEIFHKSVSKNQMLCWLERIKYIQLSDSLYFGDDMNDESCFRKIECCVAMGNSPEQLKKIAAYITDTNDNNGVIQFLISDL